MSKPQGRTCGLVMPISSTDGCSAEHWLEVKEILTETILQIKEYAFEIRLVSDADDVGVIQKRIVQNLYSADIVVCDVSGKNPNVMFELGMRLAFDKPTVIIKDDKTDYSFDTGVIEHVQYPRDLRFSRIIEFKKSLAAKAIATLKASQDTQSHSTFLKNFGTFHVAKLTEEAVKPEKFLLETLTEIQENLSSLRREVRTRDVRVGHSSERFRAIESKVSSAISDFIKENKITNLKNVSKDPKIYDYIENKIEAPRYFESPAEFRSSVDRILRQL